MKSIFIALVFLCISIITFSQENNPYNQRGTDFNNSVAIVVNDIRAGRVTELNQQALDYYSRALPLRTSIDLSTASQVLKTLITPGISVKSFLTSSSLSDYSKQILTSIIYNPKPISHEGFLQDISNKVSDVSANAPEAEKELLLSILNIMHKGSAAPTAGAASRGHCFQGESETGPWTEIPCVVMGATIGAIIGFQICGFWCGLGGAIIGAVVALDFCG